MNCEQRRDLMPLLLMEALEPIEAMALRSHLASGCPRCAAYLAEADAMLANLPYALEEARPSAEAKVRLFEKIGQEEPDQVRDRWRLLRFPMWARIAVPMAAAACLTFVVTVHYMLAHVDKQKQEHAAALAQRDRQIAGRETQIVQLRQRTELIQSPELRVITLEGRAQTQASARALWDADRKAWHFYARNLRQLAPKEAYELWFITPYGRKVGAATFKVNEQGDASLVVTIPSDVGPVNAAMVTDEPSVGTIQPTGTIHLAGKLEF